MQLHSCLRSGCASDVPRHASKNAQQARQVQRLKKLIDFAFQAAAWEEKAWEGKNCKKIVNLALLRFDRRTSGLWALRASPAPQCLFVDCAENMVVEIYNCILDIAEKCLALERLTTSGRYKWQYSIVGSVHTGRKSYLGWLYAVI